jgi:hypothetical protein
MNDVPRCGTTTALTVGREIDDDLLPSAPTAFAAGRRRDHARFIVIGGMP